MNLDQSVSKVFTVLNLQSTLRVGKIYLLFFQLFQNLALVTIFTNLADALDTQFSLSQEIGSLLTFYTHYFSSEGHQGAHFLGNNLLLMLILQVLLLALLAMFRSLEVNPKNTVRLEQSRAVIYISWIANLIYLFKTPLIMLLLNFIRTIIEEGTYALAFLPLALTVQILALVFILEQFSHSNQYLNVPLYAKLHHPIHGAYRTLKTALKAGMAALISCVENDVSLAFAVAVLLGISLVDLKLITHKKIYLHPFTQKLFTLDCTFNVNANLMILLAVLLEEEIISSNIVLLVAITSILTYQTVSCYKDFRLYQIIFESHGSKQEDEAVLLMIETIRTFKIHQNRYFGISILHNHRERCEKVTCCCQLIDTNTTNKAEKDKLFNCLIKIVLSEIIAKHPSSLLILSIFLSFQATTMKSFTSIHPAIERFLQHSKQSLSLGEKFILFQIDRSVQISLLKLNECSFVQLDIIFKQEDTFKQLEDNIEAVNAVNITKYTQLLQQNCDLNMIQILCKEVTTRVRQIESIWDSEQIGKSYNIKILQLYLIYHIYILMSRESTNQLRSIMRNKFYVLQSVKGININNLSKYMYNKNCCILESQLEHSKLGKITNSTANCNEIFNLEKKKLISQNLHSLMANFLSVEHEKLTQKWLEEESISGSLKNIIKIIFVDKKGNSFFGNLFLTLQSTGSLLVFYAIIIKQPHDDYLIVNHEGVIESFGEKLGKEGVLRAVHLQQKLSNFCNLNIQEEMKGKETLKKRLIIRDSLQILKANYPPTPDDKFTKAINNTLNENFHYDCTTLIKREHMGAESYFTITFSEITKIVRKRTRLSFSPFTQTPQLHEIWNKRLKETNEEMQVEEESEAIQLFNLNKEENNMVGGETNSVNSSLAGTEISVKIKKFYDQSMNKVKNKSLVSDPYLNKTTLAIVIFMIVSIFLSSLQSYLFNQNQASFSLNLSTYSAISNNIIQIQVSFDHIVTLYTYCSNATSQSQQCNKLIVNMLANDYEIYQEYTNHFRNFMKTLSFLSASEYSYLSFGMKENLQRGQVIKTTLKEFIEHLYYSFKILLDYIETNKDIDHFFTKEFEFLLVNWKRLLSVNKNIQNYYGDLIDSQLEMMTIIVFSIFGLLVVCILALIMSINSCKKYFQDKKYNVCLLNSCISRKFCQNYKKILMTLKLSNETKKQSYHFSEFSQFEEASTKPLKNVKYDKSRSYLYLLITSFVLLMAMNACVIISFINVFNYSPKIATNLSEIIMSSEKVIREYVTIKEIYLYNKDDLCDGDILKLIGTITQPEVPFGTDIRQSFNIIDVQYQAKYENILISNICNLSKSSFEECSNKMHYNILDFGIMAAVNFVRLQAHSNLIKLANSSWLQAYLQYNQTVQRDIDNYEYYMVKIFEQIEQELIYILMDKVSNQTSNVFVFEMLQVIIFFFILVNWIKDYSDFKMCISNLYGEVIQLPKIIFKEAKANIVHLENLLEFDF